MSLLVRDLLILMDSAIIWIYFRNSGFAAVKASLVIISSSTSSSSGGGGGDGSGSDSTSSCGSSSKILTWTGK